MHIYESAENYLEAILIIQERRGGGRPQPTTKKSVWKQTLFFAALDPEISCRGREAKPSIFLPHDHLDMRLEPPEGLVAEVVLHLAGVGGGGLGVHAQPLEEVREHPVALVDVLRDGEARGQEADGAVGVHLHVAALPELFHVFIES